jgi:uncharacterized membrane protein YcaP (DUF421 family)
METIQYLFGEGKDLNVMQMSLRALVIFFICLALLRFSGRRSFGMHTPLDNVIAILLGAILSRSVTGASPFFPTLAAAATLVILHRFCAWLGIYSRLAGRIMKGEAVVLYEKGELNEKNMKSCCITHNDLMEGLRSCCHTDSLQKIHKIYAERNGKISVIKKEGAI